MTFKSKSFGISVDLLGLIENVLSNTFQRVVLNVQVSEWEKFGVPQGSFPGPLFFLIYINDLFDGISSLVKLFADDTSLFSVQNKNNPISQHNNSLDKVCDSCYTYKMSCKPVSLRQAQRVVFSRKCAKEDNPLIDVYEYQSPRILFKLGCILMKNSITILTQKRSLVWFIKALASSETSPINFHGKLVF